VRSSIGAAIFMDDTCTASVVISSTEAKTSRSGISLSRVCHQVAVVWSWSTVIYLVCSCLAASKDAATRCEGLKGLRRQGRDTVVLSSSVM